MTVDLRPAAPEDAPSIQAVAREAWHAAYGDFLDDERIDRTIDAWYDPARLVSDDIEAPDRPVFVAVDATPSIDDRNGETARILGFAEAVPDDDESDLAHLYRIYVRPDAWGDGIGTALLDRIERTLSDRGFDRLTVSVFADNEVGVQFYEARGFERVATRYDEQFDADEYEYRTSL